MNRSRPSLAECPEIPSHRLWFKHWPTGVPRHIDYPAKPLPYLLDMSAERLGSKIAFRSTEESITYAELSAESYLFACSLRMMGLEQGDRLLLLLPNVVQFVISFYGALKAGCVLVTLNHLAREDELCRVLEETAPKAAVVLSTMKRAEKSVLKASGIKVVVVGGESENGFVSYSRLLSAGRARLNAPCEAEAPAVIQYTGSTTGAPKPVVMSNQNLLANAMQNAAWFSWDQTEIIMGVLPLCHTWGCSCCMNSPIYAGATTILIDRFDADSVLEAVQNERATVLYGSATMFAMLLAHPHLKKHDISSLKWAKAGAMPVPIELKREWDSTAGVEMTLGYGLTEASPETHDSPPGRIREGTVGIPIVDTDAEVRDLETGKEVPPGKPGELLIRGPQVTRFGYLGDEDETGRILKNGWLHTGDIAIMDQEGYFKLVDRKKDIVKCKGYTIYPVELEDVLYKHPGVKECAVVGKKHPEYGEIPKAFVIKKSGADLTPKELLSFCERRVSPLKRLREIEFTDDIPKTHVGKVLRRKLRTDE